MNQLSFDTLLAKVPVSKAEVLASDLGIYTVRDLLTYFPRAYNRRGQLTQFDSLIEKEHVTVVGRVASSQVRFSQGNRNSRLEIVLADDFGWDLHLTFFRAVSYWESKLTVGTEAIFEGKIGRFRDKLQLAQPKVEFFENQLDEAELERQRSLPIPAYPACAAIDSNKIMMTIRSVLEQCELVSQQTNVGAPSGLEDPLPEALHVESGLPSYLEALRLVHVPESKQDIERGRERLRYDEAFVLQVILAQRRKLIESSAAPAFPPAKTLLKKFDDLLPFVLTKGQLLVGEEIADDLSQPRPMHRLLQGDVGSGKTLVALRAMLQVVAGGGQAALLAPTEVLAAQHFQSLTAMLNDLSIDGDVLPVSVRLLTGSQKSKARREVMNAVVTGQAQIVVGTHALLSDNVDFFALGLVVVDEQHRFGVKQRALLRDKVSGEKGNGVTGGSADDPSNEASAAAASSVIANLTPHMLVMTATPIPRTLAMTQFGDLDVSALTERPSHRSGIQTRVVSDSNTNMGKLWGWVGHQVSLGHQVFVVCSRIGEIEEPESSTVSAPHLGDEITSELPLDAGTAATRPEGTGRELFAVEHLLQRLRLLPSLAGVQLDMLHSRLTEAEKSQVMADVTSGKCQVLIATTMIEVGVNIPNATVMIVLDADRFGLSQLHQLRGRVGRGEKPGFAILMAPSGSLSDKTLSGRRLAALTETDDGFVLSRYDIELRQEGDVLGTAQSGGLSSLKFLKAMEDEDLILHARQAATELVERDAQLSDEPGLLAAVRHRLGEDTTEYLEKG